jgi:peptidoglycan/LPS O-acetylase OafA/YrhL
VAVLSIVLYHADPTLLPGGYAGVDVFYVISGFLITGMLLRELQARGTISLRRFYARRIRRLLPMAFIVIAATVIAADYLQAPLDAARTAKDALASALYVGNYRFALEQTNYLYSSLTPSPLQHFWSLGVEEQMYLLWPVLLLAAGTWLRRRASMRGPLILLVVGSIASFAYCVRLTHTNEPWAFFSFPTRAWELGVGGILAFLAPSLRRVPRPVLFPLGLFGIAAIVWCALDFKASTPWPGYAAMVPVLGAVAVIAAGCGKSVGPTGRLLSLFPLQFSGRISYSWYLWHWPILILAPLALKHPLDARTALELAGGSGVLATISHFSVEKPLHVSAWLAKRSRRAITLGFGLTAVAVGICSTSLVALALPSASASSGPNPPAIPITTTPSTGSSNAAAAELATSTAEVHSAVNAAVNVTDVPDDLTPSLAGAFSDVPILYSTGCMDGFTSTQLNACVYGDMAASTNVVLFGDSHAAMWFPAVENAAQQLSWKLYAWTKATCPPVDIPVISPDLGRAYTECTTWRDEVLQQIATIHPSLVILGVARHYSPIYGFTMYSTAWQQALGAMVAEIQAMGSQVLVIGPVPKPAFTVASCLSENLTNVQSCATPRGSGVDLSGMRDEEATVRAAGGYYLDTLWWFCSEFSTCPPIVDNVLVYRDDNHLTATYAGFLTDPVEAAMELSERGLSAPASAVLLAPTNS